MSNSQQQDGVDGPDIILKVLEGKAFYANRFLKQVRALYPNTGGDQFPRLAPTLYLTEATSRIPDEHLPEIYKAVARSLVDNATECPSPAEVREMIAAAALQCHGLSYEKLYERAKDFLAFLPKTQDVADRWIEKLIYTTVKQISRDRFVDIAPDDWKRVVAGVILSESIELVSYQVKEEKPVTPVKMDFKKLLKSND